MTRIKFLLQILLAVLLIGCSPTTTLQPKIGTTYPPSGSDPQSVNSYPAPAIEITVEQHPIQQSTQDPSLAIITGYLVIEKDGNIYPVSDAILYLAPVLKDEQGIERVVSFDRFSSNRAITDENGKFTFLNVKFDKYGLILDRVINSYLLNDPKTSMDMLFSVEEPRLYDLGELRYDFLPDN
ncbi:hypothetical protein [Bellilinea sp.]|uniref:hypothetical protein n=1 Tax=Bellilinea sp. TaxID=2838785 RepID=UPI002ADD7CE0|nr:hypothetical protein [Bellilinea sp.]